MTDQRQILANEGVRGMAGHDVIVSDERDQPSDQVIEQRVRNRLTEYFELASSFEAQREYELAAPIVHVP